MKKQGMYMRMITASLARRKSRMLVALLAVTVGATILCGLVTVYYDLPRQMGMQFRNYGANMIVVPDMGSSGMTESQIEQAAALVDQDKIVGMARYCYETGTVNRVPVVVAGGDLEAVRATSPYWYVTGEWPSGPHQVLVGLEQAEVFSLSVGDTIEISYLPPREGEADEGQSGAAASATKRKMDFEVVGILDTGGNEEDYLFVSTDDMVELVGGELTYDVAEFSLQASSDELAAYAQTIEGDVDGVRAQLVKRVTESETAVLSKLQALVLLVTIVTLALTMICVATTMTAVVTERRREIGLRKALGATDGGIMIEFMGEGLMLGLIGGILGAFLGFGFAQIVSTNVFNSTITFLPALLPVSVLASLAVTALACILPVRNATKVDPALVLKGE